MSETKRLGISGCLTLGLVTTLLSLPVQAQMDFSGDWGPMIHEDRHERVAGRELGDYLGMPINEAARVRAESYDGDWLSMPDWQCIPMQGDTIWRGPSPVRIWKDVDPVTRELTAWHHVTMRSVLRPIYMDGRPHPSPNAPHTWAGFSTGKWEGDMLTITTTHLKEGYLDRNGVPRSDVATVTEHWMRYGDVLTVVTIVDDPVYLTEPYVLSSDWRSNPQQQIPPYPCTVVEELIYRPRDYVPHHLPGTNPNLAQFPIRFGVPEEAARGGAETMYPEYQSNLNEPR